MNTNRFVLKFCFSDIVFIAILILALVMGSQMLSLDSDLGRHLTLGNYMLDERIIPTRDLLSHTRDGDSRPPYEWLSQVLFALSYQQLKLDGVMLLTSIIIALTFSLVNQFANRRSGFPVIALLFTFVAAGASSIHWLPRPHILTFLLFVIWIELLDGLAQGKTIGLYLFPLIMVFWANLHGGFVFGILAWMAYFAGWLWNWWHGNAFKQIGKKLLIVGVASLLATFITPDLWRNWDAILNNRSAFILNRTIETMRPNLIGLSVLPYTLLLFLTVMLFVLSWKTFKASHLFLLAGLGFMSLLMARNIPLFTIACVPILSVLAADILSKSKTWMKIEARFVGFNSTSGRTVWSFAVALLAITSLAYFNFKNDRTLYEFNPSVFPVEAANFLEANHPSGNMFNEFNWGGYLLYRLWSHDLVFIDSQSDFYGEELMREYDQIMSANDDWIGLLDKYQVEWVIVKPDAPLVPALQSELHWKIVYHDITTTILHKP